ncbi:MAG TPA: hypothetical protein PKA49_13700, partial [Tepidiformaceae bacterium]|nr:hypothetical protein [Tepidiformaceae bacterium]
MASTGTPAARAAPAAAWPPTRTAFAQHSARHVSGAQAETCTNGESAGRPVRVVWTRAEEFARKHGAAAAVPAHTELGALLADPQLDAVLIATPDALHAEQAIA